MAADLSKAASAGPKYTVRELAAGAEAVFRVSPDIVTAALRMAGVSEATKEEAKKIVDRFVKTAVPPAGTKEA